MPDQGGSPARLAWTRFLARRSSRYGLGMLILIVLTGIYAPFLSNEVALVWWDHDGLRFPLIADLFNRRIYEKIYDVYFNVLALLLPVLVVAFALLRRRIGVMGRIRMGVAALAVAGTFCLLPVFPGQSGRVAIWDHRPFTASAIQQWSALPESQRPFAIFTPVKHRFDATYPGAILQAPG